MIKLVSPDKSYENDLLKFRQEFLDCGDDMDGSSDLQAFDDMIKWIEYCKQCESAQTCPDGYAEADQYLCVRESDNKIVGLIQLRRYLTAFLRDFGGHIGYCVRPCERRQGYAKQMLSLCLEKAEELGLDKVMVCCVQSNEGSRRVILSNSGVLEDSSYNRLYKENFEKYWIALK